MSCLQPDGNCANCPRLVSFRTQNQKKFPTYHNGPVASFGALDAKVLIVGLAPGLNGANQTGRPFTNDYAGDVLYPTLKKFAFAKGNYQKKADDGFELVDVRITNAVRCVPPQNKVTTTEIKNCRPFLVSEIKAMTNLKIILALGQVAHNAVLATLGQKLSSVRFGHGNTYQLDNGLILIDSYHTSRYNINTGRLTAKMFENIIQHLRDKL